MLTSTLEQRKKAAELKKIEIADYIRENKQFGKILSRVMPRYQNLFYKVFTAKNSYATAVKAKCVECSNFQKEEIRNCPAFACPLYRVRPYQDKE